MSVAPAEKQTTTEPAHCLARWVADALSQDPSLEAVTIDRAHKTISVATLGRTDAPKIAERISATLERAQQSQAERGCTLLAGLGECLTCKHPLPESQRQRITIQHEGNKTTIARVTCPTAPKFWRWRDIPWPKVVQRDVEFLEHAEHIDEWKPQLAAAILCGLCGLGAFLLRGHLSISSTGFVLAYLAGGWYTV